MRPMRGTESPGLSLTHLESSQTVSGNKKTNNDITVGNYDITLINTDSMASLL